MPSGRRYRAAKVQAFRPRSRTSAAVLASARGVARVQNDIGARFSQRQRDHAPKAAAAAGDEGALAVEAETIEHVHVKLLSAGQAA